MLARRCGWLDSAEREETLHDAYVVLLQKQRDGQLDPETMHPRELRAYLVQTAIHKALDEGKRVGRKRSVPLGDDALTAQDPSRAPDEVAAAMLDSARVREIVGELNARRQAIVKLRFFYDRTPTEVQDCLGISERAYRKDLEYAVRFIAERYELVREGRFCDSRRSLVLAYVAGIAGPGRAADAREHLASCPGCAHWAAQLREATREVASLLPMPPIADRSGLLERATQTLADLRENVSHLAGNASHHVNGAAVSVESSGATVLSGARPGAVVALVAGCVAMGGSATYCAVQGVPDSLRPSFLSQEKPRKMTAKKKEPKRTAKANPTPASSKAQATPAVTQTASAGTARKTTSRAATSTTSTAKSKKKKTSSTSTAAARQASRESAAAQEFGLEGAGEPVSSGGSSSSTLTASAASSGGGSGGSSSSGSSSSGSSPPANEAGRSEFGP